MFRFRIYFWGLLWFWRLTFSKHWMNFLSNYVSLVTYLSYIFLLDGSILTSDEEKEEKIQFFNYFWRMLLKFEEKKLKIHKLNQLLITWIGVIQTLVKEIPETKLSHWYFLSKTYIKNHIQKLEPSLSWINLCVIQIIASSLVRFWVRYRKSAV